MMLKLGCKLHNRSDTLTTHNEVLEVNKIYGEAYIVLSDKNAWVDIVLSEDDVKKLKEFL